MDISALIALANAGFTKSDIMSLVAPVPTPAQGGEQTAPQGGGLTPPPVPTPVPTQIPAQGGQTPPPAQGGVSTPSPELSALLQNLYQSTSNLELPPKTRTAEDILAERLATLSGISQKPGQAGEIK